MHSTQNLNDGYLGSGIKLKRSIKKYGRENHEIEILEFFRTKESLVERERELITLELLNDPMCLNLNIGGMGGRIGGYVHSEETKKKMSDALIGRKNPHFGKKHSDSAKDKISKARKGKSTGPRPCSETTKEKLSKAFKGNLPGNSRKIMVFGIEYPSVRHASRHVDLSCPTIRKRALSSDPLFNDIYYI